MPLDLPGLVRQTLMDDEREPDGLLHASGDLVSPMRHVMLAASGAHERPRSTADYTTLMTGTLWHTFMENALRKTRRPIMTEVKLNEYMPTGWGGTADWIIWSDEYRKFVLADLKTIKGAGLPWVIRDGAKEAHLWQLSAYWYALKNMGLDLVEGFAVLYLPKDSVAGQNVEPTVMDCALIEEEVVLGVMTWRRKMVDLYLAGDTPLYEPEPRKMTRVANKKTGNVDIVLKPHWSAAYCRFTDCGCSGLGQTKVGHYTAEGEWVPRDGQEDPCMS